MNSQETSSTIESTQPFTSAQSQATQLIDQSKVQAQTIYEQAFQDYVDYKISAQELLDMNMMNDLFHKKEMYRTMERKRLCLHPAHDVGPAMIPLSPKQIINNYYGVSPTPPPTTTINNNPQPTPSTPPLQPPKKSLWDKIKVPLITAGVIALTGGGGALIYNYLDSSTTTTPIQVPQKDINFEVDAELIPPSQ